MGNFVSLMLKEEQNTQKHSKTTTYKADYDCCIKSNYFFCGIYPLYNSEKSHKITAKRLCKYECEFVQTQLPTLKRMSVKYVER